MGDDVNDCPKCDHQSSSDLEAYQHWLEHLKQQQPIIEKGMLVTMIGPNGQQFTDRVSDVVFDRKTGSQKIVVGDGEDKTSKAMALVQNFIDDLVVLTKPRWVPLWAWKVWLRIRR
jgi:hypothetical protein